MSVSVSEEREEQDDEQEATGRGLDPELKAISAIVRILNKFDPDAQARIVRYTTSRYANVESRGA